MLRRFYVIGDRAPQSLALDMEPPEHEEQVVVRMWVESRKMNFIISELGRAGT
jgi:hypothetical protein